MIFATPQFLWLLLFIPIYIGLLFLVRTRIGFFVPTYYDLLQARKKSWTRTIPWIRHIAVVCIIAATAVALARPQVTHQTEHVSKNGIDIVVALDVSDSMRAEDLKPNRISAAKKALEDFIATRMTDRVGVVIFSGAPFTQSPLTFDYNILSYYVKNISTESIDQGSYGIGGTAIGDAILASLNRLQSDPERTKVIILISDGDANVGIDPKVAAYKAKEAGVKIYTIGVGKEDGAPIPVTDRFGNKTIAKNRDGSVYMATFNDAALKEIADITGGQFMRVEDASAFEKALADIGALEKTDVEVNTETTTKDSFWNYLLIAVIGMWLYFLFELRFLAKQ